MKPIRPWLRPALLGLTLLLSAPLATQAQEGRPPAAVSVMTLQPQSVTLTTTLPGRVVASARAEVRPQVAGIITERQFREGGQVEEGDVLYQIDPASYDAALAIARASVAQAKAGLEKAEKEARRIDALQSRNVASASAADEADAALAIAAANLEAAEAQLQSAQIEKDRTTIRARLSGEIGRSLTSPGALVTASQATPLAVIQNIDPVYVDVTQSAAELLAWRRSHGNGPADLADPSVTLTLADGVAFDQKGMLTAAEPEVDEQTGVVVLRMSFDNPDKLLLPGMYVQVEMPTETLDSALVVPQQAVSRDRRGQATALIVTEENVVEQRELTILQARGADWIVSDGLSAGDRLVVAGFQKTGPGATVTPQEVAAPQATGAEADPVAPEGEQTEQTAPRAEKTEASAEAGSGTAAAATETD
ncbi:efflux RND transporter periplasmic adaptor subunit [Sulfitobacter aestuarii]|uniref:Efflux RND transporter periplasmic adaptor subunit n=1 Tax=Sulfitobacter aestuarii TaxID=2161676 RepID=A0ABW5U4Q7_9RHOB